MPILKPFRLYDYPIISMKTLKKSEEIKKQIEAVKQNLLKLEEQYHAAKLEERLEPLWIQSKPRVNSSAEETIGVFNISKCRAILHALNHGKKLFFEHLAYGKTYVEMNPQRNAIYCTHEDFEDDRILFFALSGSGDWYIVNETE